ncbi:hypothetical protein GSI_12796 [Ganoderma sinense ZZ0214-1]|uniref:Uncharacterized protein n=1 Tax=Ganoderma sinense ZZ0214-1 TaxID=1077348 RepID=A0A2G8RTT2_9APHY|nr:hypothetical protein GSI_12796 [Ganoderma sinense ZZ0214-1]
MSDTEVPSWPSLYDISIELFPISHREPIQPHGKYLTDANDVFRFTLFWTLVLYAPAFIICGLYAFFNLSFPPRRPDHKGHKRPGPSNGGPSFSSADNEAIPLRRRDDQQLGAGARSQSQFRVPSRAPARQNETRSRLTFAVLVFMLFATFALGSAVVGSAIIGFVLAGLYKAGNYNMSTWIPFLGAMIQTLLGFLALWPTVIDII